MIKKKKKPDFSLTWGHLFVSLIELNSYSIWVQYRQSWKKKQKN